ncbi:MAG: galactokinase [Planctomycetota bacterium]|nr:galactokinase [Planctomycetota bacterium]
MQAGLRAAFEEHRRRFLERFGPGGEVRLFFSPGRVNLMGAHLDYNGGPVMPTAIDRGTFLAIRSRKGPEVHLASTLEPGELSASLADLPREGTGTWHDYPLGVVHHISPEGELPEGVDVLFGGNLPIGAGLSSSASICVGTAFALNEVWGLGATTLRCVEAALWSEREFVGVRCGIMDPYAVGFSRPDHLLWIDCKDASMRHIPLDSNAVVVAVVDSGIRRDLAKGAFNERVEECARAFERLRHHVPGATCLRDVPLEAVEEHAGELDGVHLRRARHVAAEVARTFEAREALESGDLRGFGERISTAHESLRDLFEVSVPELDHLVESALEWDGVLGSRLTGAGFGGCTVVLLRREACEGFAEHVQTSFEARFGPAPRVDFFRGDAGPREIV